MKVKAIIASLGFAISLGVSSLFGLKPINNVAKAEASTPDYIYFKFESATEFKTYNPWSSYWSASYLDIKAYFFTGKTDVGTAWPGDPCLRQERIGNVWYNKYEVPAGAESVIFNAFGGKDPQDQTVDLTIPTDGKNMFTCTNWQMYSNQNGEWSDLDDTKTFSGFCLRGDWDDGWTRDGQIQMTTTDGVHTASNVPLSAGGRVKIVNYIDYILSEWVTPNIVYPSQSDNQDFSVSLDNEGNAIVSEDCIYNINLYWNGSDAHLDFERIPSEALSEAITFANGFVNDMHANCPYNYSTGTTNPGKSASTVASTWSSKKSAYLLLSEGAKTFLSTQSGRYTRDITLFWDSYDYVYINFSEVRALDSADFLGRTPLGSIINNPVINQNSDTAVIIVVTAAISLLTFSGVMVFKKRKSI